MADYKPKVGDQVTVLVDTPNDEPLTGVVRVVNDPDENPGKLVGVELDNYVKFGHSLDGLVDEREDPSGKYVVGKGWWTRPENLEKV